MTEPVTDDKLDLLGRAAGHAAQYVRGERSATVANSEADLSRLLDAATPDRPIAPRRALDLLAEHGLTAAVRTTGGRYFGFVNGGVTPIALAASVIAGAWDQNVALPVMSPVSAALDAQAASWLVDVLGLPGTATAAFCAGASVANLTAVLCARDALLRRAGWDAASAGLNGAPPITVVTSAEIHVTVTKAIRLAGLGTDSIVVAPTDDCGRVDPDRFPATEGLTLVLLQAGNVNTGHSDPFRTIIGRVDRARSWVHIDGAFGLWANAVPGLQSLVDGVELADSWATDAHKWLNAPYDCAAVILARHHDLIDSMRVDAAYVPAGDERSLMNLGLQMSQAARAVPVWAILATEGRAGVAASIERCCRAAALLAELLGAAGAEVLAPVVLNQVLLAFTNTSGDDITDALVAAIQADGRTWMGATTWQGRRAMRVSVSDVSTTPEDIAAAAATVIELWETLA